MAAVVIWRIIRRQGQAGWATRLAAVATEIGRTEASVSPGLRANGFEGYVLWSRYRPRVLRLERDVEELVSLAPEEGGATGADLLRALTRWRLSLDAAQPGSQPTLGPDQAETVAAAAMALRTAVKESR